MRTKDVLVMLSELGQGAGGKVYKALHVPTLKLVAVKVCNSVLASCVNLTWVVCTDGPALRQEQASSDGQRIEIAIRECGVNPFTE